MKPLDQLTLLAEALHGARWQRATARELGRDRKAVQRWLSGLYEPSTADLEALRIMAQRRVMQLQAALTLTGDA